MEREQDVGMSNGWTELRGVQLLRRTAKSWQVKLPNGQEPFVPTTQMESVPSHGNIGSTVDIKVKTWLVDKWKSAAGHGPTGVPTFEFDPENDLDVVAGEFVASKKVKGHTEVQADFLFDYSKKQLLAACMAYRSVLSQLAKRATEYRPQLSSHLERYGEPLDGRAGSPDKEGFFPMIRQSWANQDDLREIGKQADGVLNAHTIGQAMLDKMSAIERLLEEKRADVAAELLRSMDEDED